MHIKSWGMQNLPGKIEIAASPVIQCLKMSLGAGTGCHGPDLLTCELLSLSIAKLEVAANTGAFGNPAESSSRSYQNLDDANPGTQWCFHHGNHAARCVYPFHLAPNTAPTKEADTNLPACIALSFSLVIQP